MLNLLTTLFAHEAKLPDPTSAKGPSGDGFDTVYFALDGAAEPAQSGIDESVVEEGREAAPEVATDDQEVEAEDTRGKQVSHYTEAVAPANDAEGRRLKIGGDQYLAATSAVQDAPRLEKPEFLSDLSADALEDSEGLSLDRQPTARDFPQTAGLASGVRRGFGKDAVPIGLTGGPGTPGESDSAPGTATARQGMSQPDASSIFDTVVRARNGGTARVPGGPGSAPVEGQYVDHHGTSEGSWQGSGGAPTSRSPLHRRMTVDEHQPVARVKPAGIDPNLNTDNGVDTRSKANGPEPLTGRGGRLLTTGTAVEESSGAPGFRTDPVPHARVPLPSATSRGRSAILRVSETLTLETAKQGHGVSTPDPRAGQDNRLSPDAEALLRVANISADRQHATVSAVLNAESAATNAARLKTEVSTGNADIRDTARLSKHVPRDLKEQTAAHLTGAGKAGIDATMTRDALARSIVEQGVIRGDSFESPSSGVQSELARRVSHRLGENRHPIQPQFSAAGPQPTQSRMGAPFGATELDIFGVNAPTEPVDAKTDIGASVASDARIASGAQVPSHSPIVRSDLSAHVLRQVQQNLSRLADGSTEIRLSPEELGQVRLQLVSSEGGLVVHIQADRSETLDLMRRHVDQLARDLAAAGHDASDFTFHQGNRDTPDQSRDGQGAVLADADIPETPLPEQRSLTDGIDIRL